MKRLFKKRRTLSASSLLLMSLFLCLFLSVGCSVIKNNAAETPNIFVNEKKDNNAEITVTDQGCGIAPENQKKIFDRFFRVENNIHTIKGTGLGLHLVKQTVEKYHNGKVFINSELGKGSTFGIILPIEVLENTKSANI